VVNCVGSSKPKLSAVGLSSVSLISMLSTPAIGSRASHEHYLGFLVYINTVITCTAKRSITYEYD